MANVLQRLRIVKLADAVQSGNEDKLSRRKTEHDPKELKE